jgi:methyl-accepting chemotaxis protein
MPTASSRCIGNKVLASRHEIGAMARAVATLQDNATEDIQSQIGTIQTETTRAVGAIVETIRSIREVTAGMASAVEKRGAATAEIARNVQAAAVGTREVTRSIIAVMDLKASRRARLRRSARRQAMGHR